MLCETEFQKSKHVFCTVGHALSSGSTNGLRNAIMSDTETIPGIE